MRQAHVAAVSLAAAVLGGALVLLVAWAAGWIGDARTETIVAPAPRLEDDGADLPAVAPSRPLTPGVFDPARIYAERSAGVVTIYADFGGSEGQGSGFVVSGDGLVLTNAHVITTAGESEDVSPAEAVYVEFKDGDTVPARIVGWDVFDDVGVLRVDSADHQLQPLPLGDSGRVVVGEPVAAIGSPFGAENSLSVGVVSATRRSIRALTSAYTIVDAIQIDAPINRGNSGGPLFDARGRVVGINAQIRSGSGVNEGVGFAVPINSAKRSLRQLLESGKVSYAYVGISTGDLTPGLADRLDLDVSRGALIEEVVDDGPARKAGLRGGSRRVEHNGNAVVVGGDVVVGIDGHRVSSGDDLVRVVSSELAPGDVATFRILRGGSFLNVPVRLGERPATPPG
jgi:S1-C subfamily serine protease